jgi:hypothetical protein
VKRALLTTLFDDGLAMSLRPVIAFPLVGNCEAETDDTRQPFKILTLPTVIPIPIQPGSYAARLEKSIAELREFLDDPVALIARAKELLEDRAPMVLTAGGFCDQRIRDLIASAALWYWGWNDPLGFSLWCAHVTGLPILAHIIP